MKGHARGARLRHPHQRRTQGLRDLFRYKEGEDIFGPKSEDETWFTRSVGMPWKESDVVYFEGRPWVPVVRNGDVLDRDASLVSQYFQNAFVHFFTSPSEGAGLQSFG